MKARTIPAFQLTAVLLAALVLFPLLYFLDNKYTWKGPQPIAGLLCVSERDLEEYPLRFLAREWAYYPDVLLSPADFENASPAAYMRYVSIGQYGGMDLGDPDRSPHGSGTYALDLLLPETPRAYALELPVIFSAYRFYVNGELAQQTGEPEPARYAAVLQNKAVTFYGGGFTRLLLAVTDYSSVYSGLTSPPAFGEPGAVSAMRELRAFVYALALAMAGGAFCTALYFAARLGHRELWLYAALCACLFCLTANSFLYSFLPMPALTFGLRFLAIYAAYPLVLLLHCSICGAEQRAAPLALATAFSVCAALYGLWGARLDYASMRLFSRGIFLFKCAFAAYLIITALLALKQKRASAGPQFLVTAFFAASLTADRILPLFDPVLGGWFNQTGLVVLVAVIGCSLAAEMADAYRFRGIFEQERRLMERQLSIQKEQFSQLSGRIAETRRLSHDFRHHLHTIRSLADAGDLPALRDYLGGIGAQSPAQESLVLCAHPAANALLQYFSAAAAQNEIAFQFRADIPADLPFPDPDLSILLGNLLENALEACLRQKNGPRFIRLRGNGDEGRLILTIKNSCDGSIRTARRRFLSSKHGGPGIGTESVRELVKRYGGILRFLPGDRTFHVQVLIPLSAVRARKPE